MTSRRPSPRAPRSCASARRCSAPDSYNATRMTITTDSHSSAAATWAARSSAACCAPARAPSSSASASRSRRRAPRSHASLGVSRDRRQRGGDRRRRAWSCWRSSRRTRSAVLAPLAATLRRGAPAAHLGVRRHARRGTGALVRRRRAGRARDAQPPGAGRRRRQRAVCAAPASARRSARAAEAVMQAVGEVVWVATARTPWTWSPRCPAADRRTSSCWPS